MGIRNPLIQWYDVDSRPHAWLQVSRNWRVNGLYVVIRLFYKRYIIVLHLKAPSTTTPVPWHGLRRWERSVTWLRKKGVTWHS